MSTYKSNTRVVLNTTLANAPSYSSGSLFVGDLFELNLDVHVTSLTNTGGAPEFLISRIDANGNTYNLNGVNITATGNFAVSVGAGLDNHSFGDQIQLDLDIPAGDSLSAQVSIIGKG